MGGTCNVFREVGEVWKHFKLEQTDLKILLYYISKTDMEVIIPMQKHRK